MKLITIGGLSLLASTAIVVACSDQPSAPSADAGALTLQEGARLRIHGTATAVTHTPAGTATHQLPGWSAAGAIRDGLARDDGGAGLGVLALTRVPARPEVTTPFATRTGFIDSTGHQHWVVWVYVPDVKPVKSIAHYVDGKLVSVTGFGWTAARGGWTLGSIKRRFYRDGALTTEVMLDASSPATMVFRGPGQDAWRRFAFAAVDVLRPPAAQAQAYWGKCRTEWLQYIAAQAALSAATIALEANPANAALYAAWLAAAAAATIAEMKLWICQDNQESRDFPLVPGGSDGSGATGHAAPAGCDVSPGIPGCIDLSDIII